MDIVEQKRLEVLAIYANRPPAQSLSAFLRFVNVPRNVWYEWLEDQAFSNRVDRIDAKRRKVTLDRLDRNLDRLLKHFVDSTLASDDPAKGVRLALEALGVIGPRGAQTVNVAVQQTSPAVQITQDPARVVQLYGVLRDYAPGIFGCETWEELEAKAKGSVPALGAPEPAEERGQSLEIEAEVVAQDQEEVGGQGEAPMGSEDD